MNESHGTKLVDSVDASKSIDIKHWNIEPN